MDESLAAQLGWKLAEWMAASLAGNSGESLVESKVGWMVVSKDVRWDGWRGTERAEKLDVHSVGSMGE